MVKKWPIMMTFLENNGEKKFRFFNQTTYFYYTLNNSIALCKSIRKAPKDYSVPGFFL